MSAETAQYADRGLAPGLRDAVRALMCADPRSVWQLPDQEVADALATIGQARQLLEVAEVALVREGVARGLPAESSWSAQDWVGVSEGRHAPRPSTRHVAAVVRVADAATTSALHQDEDMVGAGGIRAVIDAVADGSLPVGKADQLVRFHASVRRAADPELLEADLGLLLGAARDEVLRVGPDARATERVPGLDDTKLAAAITQTGRMLRPDAELREEDETLRASRSLTKAPGPCGLTRYRVDMDPEGAAIIDAALAALSEPITGPEGEPDERPYVRRCADALITIIGRGVSSPGEAPKTDKAQVLVTISLQALTADLAHGRCGACGQDLPRDPFGRAVGTGHAGGVAATGQVLAPSAVRKLACEGGIIPALLGTAAEPLDLGRAARYFTTGQKRALYLRDGGCTFPGCTMPAHWSDAHHVDYWSMGGTTDIDNAALLCERHHTRVHQRDLTCTITPRGVTWHT